MAVRFPFLLLLIDDLLLIMEPVDKRGFFFCTLLQKYRINNESQLSLLADALQADIDSLVFSRRELYRRQRRGEDVSAEIKEISLALRPIRRELKCCQQVADRIPQIQEHIRLTRQAEEQNKSEKTKPRERLTIKSQDPR